MFRKLNTCAVPGYAPLCLDSNDPDTIACGFKQRLLRNVPIGDKNELEGLRTFVREYLRKHVPKAQPLEFEEWLSTTTYSESRKQELRLSHADLRGGAPNRR